MTPTRLFLTLLSFILFVPGLGVASPAENGLINVDGVSLQMTISQVAHALGKPQPTNLSNIDGIVWREYRKEGSEHPISVRYKASDGILRVIGVSGTSLRCGSTLLVKEGDEIHSAAVRCRAIGGMQRSKIPDPTGMSEIFYIDTPLNKVTLGFHEGTLYYVVLQSCWK